MLALAVLSILCTWMVCGGVCIGAGSLMLRWLGFDFCGLEAFWSGLAIVVALLQVYHFFRPIDSVAVVLLAALGLAGLLWNRRSLLQRSNGATRQGPSVLLFCAAAALIALRSAGPCEHYDTGLYGAQAIRWFTTYPLLPGLANVLVQLGFNSSVFLPMAALDQGPWRGLAHHLFAGFVVAAFFAAIVPAALRVFRGKEVFAADWFLTLLFVPAAITALMGKLSGANTDVPTTVVCLVAAFFLFRALDSATSPLARHSERSEESLFAFPELSLLVAMLLFSLAVTFKLSSMVFAFTGWLVAFFALCRGATGERKRVIVAGVIVSAAIVLPWMGRGLMLSGYPLFPSTILSIPVEWKVPAAAAHYEAYFARSFARIPQIPLAETSEFRWLGPWFRDLVREREGFLIPLVLALAGGIAAFAQRSRGLPRWLWLLAPSFWGLLFWFFAAPAMRFGEPLFWTAGATLGTFAALRFLDRPVRMRFALVGLLLLTGWAAHPRLLWSSYLRPSLGVHSFLRLPEAKLELRHTPSGLSVYVPIGTNQCWGAPLPCAPYLSDFFRLREPGEVKGGFAYRTPNDVQAVDPQR